jgi:hypothetical protein
MGGLGIEGGDGNGVGGVGDDGLKVLKKQATMQSIGTVLDEVAG